jgi:hypothetical protein
MDRHEEFQKEVEVKIEERWSNGWWNNGKLSG